MRGEDPRRSRFRILGLALWSLAMLALGVGLGAWLTASRAVPAAEDGADSVCSSSLTQSSEGLDAEDGSEAEASQPAAEQPEDQEEDQTEEAADSSAASESGVEPEDPELTREEAITAQAQEILDSMTLAEQVYQMFIVTPETLTGVSTVTQAGATTQAALQSHPVGGLVYFAANIVTPEQCTTMISNTQSYSKIGLFIAVDEEGGRVARIGKNSAMGTTAFPSMSDIGSTGDVSKAYEVGSTIGTEIAQFGFNLDFAPVADVNSNPNNTVIGDRAFGSDPEAVAEMVASAVQGFRDSGMLCTLKHFPGHGDTDTDSHYGYTEVLKTLQELRSVEFLPFQAGIDAGADFVMMGHISVPEVTGDDTPASLSATMIAILRDELNFQGLIITDSMVMSAITDRYTSAQAAVLAVQAGVDVILEPSSLTGAVQGILSAVEDGTISEERIRESVLKILEVKIRNGIIASEF
ncbi:MAG: glycoside hydrolase family 3 protein [Clostridiales bacterium]|nr:glycoside hydrolase family 3 protein [Clostridiales bacterium]